MLEFKLDMMGKELERKLTEEFRKLSQFAVPFKRSGVYMLRETDKNFRNTKTPEGKQWKRLSNATKAARVHGRGKGGPRPLQDTGVLKNSLSFTIKSNNVLKIFSAHKWAAFHQGINKAGKQVSEHVIKPVTKKWLTVPVHRMGRQKTAAEWRDTGKTFIAKNVIFFKKGAKSILPIFVLKKQVTIPARPFLGFSDENADTIEKIFDKWVGEQIKRSKRTK